MLGEKERQGIPTAVRKQVIERDQGKCVVCYSNGNICHHKNPRGESVVDNLVMLCLHCHEYIHWMLRHKGWKMHLPFRYYGR
jgi:5-methylcytosine-specific restriction endonuclease McrA